MKPARASDSGAPQPEHLAAYADGQLDPALRRRVESWLRHHPEAATEIEEQRRLARLWKATRPAEPEPGAWEAVQAGIAACLAQTGRRIVEAADKRGLEPRIRVRPWRRLLGLVAVGGMAAGLLLVMLLPQHQGKPPVLARSSDRAKIEVEKPAAVEMLEVVAPDDVEIVSLRADDRGTLVVGEPPVSEPLALASPGDVAFERIEPAADGMVPEVHVDEGSVTALVVAPVGAAAARR
jgi:anti-sigma factor RsiW